MEIAKREGQSVTAQDVAAAITVNGVRVEIVEKGRGRPILFLHPEIGMEPDAPVLDRLAEHGRVIAPSHPGFGGSDQPKSFTTVDDLAYFYLDLIDQLDLNDTVVVGVSLGAWIAAEIAVKSTQRLSHLVLANAVGIKVGSRETRDIADIFATTDNELSEISYFDPKRGTRDHKAMPEADVRTIARNREAAARYGWSPYMHNPKLKGRLHRIGIPTLFLWGVADRILSDAYGRAYCAAIPGARFEIIDRAGHFPHIEQPEEFARRVVAFTQGQAK
jgi:pimeloyl-ACP methyl ester carboxylesterase